VLIGKLTGISIIPAPAPAVPTIPPGDDIILYLHGGPGSRLEEASDLLGPLLDAGKAHGRQFTIIAFDQPSQGYTEHLDPLCVAQPHDEIGDLYPLVQFNEDFVKAFVDALDQLVPIKNRNIVIIGGSTGGMLALRMGHRTDPEAWITNLKIVAWNPASVWSTYAHDVLKGFALTVGFDRAEGHDASQGSPSNRKVFFDQVFGPPAVPWDFVKGQANPEEWYRGNRGKMVCPKDFISDSAANSSAADYPDYSSKIPTYYGSNQRTQQPFRCEWACKFDYIASGRLEMQEIYSDPFRRWHWRFGTEELLFSFFNDSWTGPAETRFDKLVYQSIRTPTLLMASDDDWNEGYVPADKVAEASAALGLVVGGPAGSIAGLVIGSVTDLAAGPITLAWENRWTWTGIMGRYMQNAPGYLMLVHNTGHSIHNERPKLLAERIADFVSNTTPGPPLQHFEINPDGDENCNSDFDPTSPVFKAPSPNYPAGRFPTPAEFEAQLAVPYTEAAARQLAL
jgi:pimeloyl-ACP methyl ester carboxylesterase